jgi:hypothetical protein
MCNTPFARENLNTSMNDEIVYSDNLITFVAIKAV